MTGPIVILVLAGQLQSMMGLIDITDSRFKLIIHVDEKVPVDVSAIPKPSHVTFTAKRYPVFWGGFNMIHAITEMIDEAYHLYPDFKRLVLITGDTLPTVSLDHLYEKLSDLSLEYMQLVEIPNDPTLRHKDQAESVKLYGSVQAWRFQNYVFSDDEFHCPRSREATKKKYVLQEGQVDHIRGSVHRATGSLLSALPPRPNLFGKLYYGVSWWSLSRQSMDLIIDDIHSTANIEYFRLLQVPDEHFFQTILGNKRRALVSLGKTLAGPLVYVDYSNPLRKEFKGQDYITVDLLRTVYSKYKLPFARKYNPELTPEIRNAIESKSYFSHVLNC